MNKLKFLFSLILIICITISVSGCASGNKTTAGNTGNNNQQSGASSVVANPNITVTEAYDFSEGLAWAEFSKDGVDYYGVINTQGKIIYENPLDNQTIYACGKFKGGMGLIRGSAHTLINTDGKIIASSEDGDFDKVIDYGGGTALVYKYNGGVTTSEHLYGVIDNNGNWIQQLSDWGDEAELSYIGSGMYGYTKNLTFSSVKVAYNSKSNLMMYFSDELSFEFTNGKIYLYGGSLSTSGKPDLTISGGEDNVNFGDSELTEVNTDGTYKKILEISDDDSIDISGDKLLIKRHDNDNAEIYNLSDGTTSTITKYPASMVSMIFFSDERGLMILNGQDGNHYFTVIDEKGNEQFEPIKYDYLNDTSSDIIAAKNTDESSKFSIYDENGNKLAQELNYIQLYSFSDGIAVAVDEDSNTCYINSKGEKILTNLSE